MKQLSLDSRPAIRLGDRRDYVDLRVVDGMLLIDIVGAPVGDLIYHAVQEGYSRGMVGLAMPTLVNVSSFHGNIDWSAVKALSELAEWGKGSQNLPHVAYLSDDPFFALVIKSVSVMFPRACHRLFTEREAAMDWLRMPSLPVSKAS